MLTLSKLKQEGRLQPGDTVTFNGAQWRVEFIALDGSLSCINPATGEARYIKPDWPVGTKIVETERTPS